MRLLVCGSRNINLERARKAILQWIQENGTVDTVIQGCGGNVDRAAREAAKILSIDCKPYPADWRLGSKAGPIRNSKMIDDGKPDYCLSLVGTVDVQDSRGTHDAIKKCRSKGITVSVIDCVLWLDPEIR